MDRAVAGGGDDQTVDAGVDQRTDGAAIDAGRAGDDLHPRPGRALGGRSSRPRADSAGHGRRSWSLPASTRPSTPASPDENASSRDEWTLRTSRAECSVPAKATTHARPPRLGGNGDRVGQVARPVGLARGRRPHRPGQDHRLGDGHDAGEEIGRLLERVGAMGDDDARHLGPRRMVGHPLRELPPGGEIHVLAVELGDLLGLDPHACRSGTPRRPAHRRRRCRRRSRGCRRAKPRCRRSCRRCRGRRRSKRGALHYFVGLDENTALDVNSA